MKGARFSQSKSLLESPSRFKHLTVNGKFYLVDGKEQYLVEENNQDSNKIYLTPLIGSDMITNIVDKQSQDPKYLDRKMYELRKEFRNRIDMFASSLANRGYHYNSQNMKKYFMIQTKHGYKLEHFFDDSVKPYIQDYRKTSNNSPDLSVMINDYQLYRKKGYFELMKKYYENSYFLNAIKSKPKKTSNKSSESKTRFDYSELLFGSSKNIVIPKGFSTTTTSVQYIESESPGVSNFDNPFIKEEEQQKKTRRVDKDRTSPIPFDGESYEQYHARQEAERIIRTQEIREKIEADYRRSMEQLQANLKVPRQSAQAIPVVNKKYTK